MPEFWYDITMSFIGILTLLGIVLTWLIFRRTDRQPSLLLVLGGLMTAGGFTGVVLFREAANSLLTVLILTGPALVAYSLASGDVVKVSGRLMLQVSATLLSLLLAGHHSTVAVDIVYAGPFLAVLLLMNSLISSGLAGELREKLLVGASWMVVLFSWTRYLIGGTPRIREAAIVALYMVPVTIWVGIAVSIYLSPVEHTWPGKLLNVHAERSPGEMDEGLHER
ncbi:hypothetical protein JCM16138_10230 [Thermococcus atlanticus]